MRFRSFFEPAKCPHCGSRHDAHTAITSDARPEPGDVSVCADCVQISIFDAHGQLVVPSSTALAALQADPALMRAQVAVRAARDRRRVGHAQG